MEYTQFQQLASTFDVDVSQGMYDQLKIYANHLIEYNNKVNLTAIVEVDQIFIKHFLDSLLVLKHVQDKEIVADIGTGAGFPGLVLAIFSPNTKFELVEPTQKRVAFLLEVVNLLGLHNVVVHNARAEELEKHKEKYDVVVSRAVARLDILSELCIPLVKVNGLFIALKGAHAMEEIEISKNALSLLYATIESVEMLKLPYKDEIAIRNNIIMRKHKKTANKYPRMYSKIKKQPL